MNNKIIGPVIPLPTPFTEDHKVDHGALAQYVTFLVNNGVRNVMTTVGTSRYNLLSDNEIKSVNNTVVTAAKEKAVTIVANPITGGTSKAVEFARHAEEIGADFLLLIFPERYYGDDNTFAFFKKVADSSRGEILIHEMPMRNGLGSGNVQYSLPLLEQLLSIKNIVGFKEESLDPDYSNKIVETFSSKAEMIGAGGGMSRYYNRDFQRGSKAFLGGIGNFIPTLELDFYQKMISGRTDEAGRIVKEIEIPYFEKVVPLGWHPTLKAALGIKKLLPPYERPPMIEISGGQLDQLRQILTHNNWL